MPPRAVGEMKEEQRMTEERLEQIRAFLSENWLMRDGISALDTARELFRELITLRAALAAREEERERLAAERDALLEAVGRAVFPNLQDDGRKVYPWVKTALTEIADMGADVARLNWLEAAPRAVAHVQFGCAFSAEITTLRAAIDFASSASALTAGR